MNFLRSILICILFCNVGVAQASTQTGVIEDIQIMNDGRIAVNFSTAREGKPACAIHNYFFIADENSAAGKAQLSLLLAAHAAGRQVSIVGTDACIRWVDGENIYSIKMPKS